MEAFSDGVLAIIITIMVLELKQPVGDIFNDLLALRHTIFVYMQSFLFVAIYWVNHYILMHNAKRVNVRILWTNMTWLFLMSLIPFTTVWIGNHPLSWVPMTIYFAGMLLSCIVFQLLRYRVARENTPSEPFHLGLRSIVSIIIFTFFIGFSTY